MDVEKIRQKLEDKEKELEQKKNQYEWDENALARFTAAQYNYVDSVVNRFLERCRKWENNFITRIKNSQDEDLQAAFEHYFITHDVQGSDTITFNFTLSLPTMLLSLHQFENQKYPDGRQMYFYMTTDDIFYTINLDEYECVFSDENKYEISDSVEYWYEKEKTAVGGVNNPIYWGMLDAFKKIYKYVTHSSLDSLDFKNPNEDFSITKTISMYVNNEQFLQKVLDTFTQRLIDFDLCVLDSKINLKCDETIQIIVKAKNPLLKD